MVPIFVISLKSSEDRRAAITRRLNALNLPFEFFDATPVSDLTPANISFYNGRRRRLRKGNDLYPAELACFLSHKRVIEHVRDLGLDYAIILEDDCVLAPNFREVLSACMLWSDRWDIVRFTSGKNTRYAEAAT